MSVPDKTRHTLHDSVQSFECQNCGKTSSESSLGRGRDKVIKDIENRIADFTFIPVEHGQELLVLRYEVGQKNLPHYDTYGERPSIKNGGPPIATVLMYLSDVEEGGETVFPSAKGDTMSECGKKELSVKPKMGDALLFWTIRPDGTLDPSSLHGGNPVIKGNKWACTKWLHMQEFKV